MEFHKLIDEGVPHNVEVEHTIRIISGRCIDTLHLKVRMIDGRQWLVLMDAHGPTVGYLGNQDRSEPYFRAPFEVVQRYLAFEPVDLRACSHAERERFIRLMGELLKVIDAEREQFLFQTVAEAPKPKRERKIRAPQYGAVA